MREHSVKEGHSLRFGWAAVLGLGLVLSACGGGGGSDKSERLPGTRISVIGLEEGVEVDPAMRGVEVRLPKPYANEAWPQAGGYASHAMHHLALSANPQRVWRTDIGAGSESTRRILSQPVVANGVIYASDSEWGVSATDARTGDRLWRIELKDREEKKDSAMGGGVAYHDGRVYVSSGVGFTAALDARSGEELWRTTFEVALRGAPTVADGQVYVITHDNQLFALEADTGDQLWSFVAISEAAGMLGAASPAVSGDVVVAAFSSGELIALRADNGNAVWRDSLTRTGRMTALSTLNDIDGHPVIDRGLVFGVGHSGR
ncbi:MAG: PQQ-binding-like beta-propeller repeat protein, partial [Alphaproteobacteria bacterium]|nr:PQQ-binding-like beta-propeller repeat protein [Alphaproteobacteria bacterium]